MRFGTVSLCDVVRVFAASFPRAFGSRGRARAYPRALPAISQAVPLAQLRAPAVLALLVGLDEFAFGRRESETLLRAVAQPAASAARGPRRRCDRWTPGARAQSGRAPPALRERFATLVQYEHVSDRAPASGAGALALFPECDGGLVDATGRAGWRWLFAFCIAALNDPRVAEVSQRDYDTRLAISNQFTPLIREMLLPNQNPSDL